ncbi:MAG: chorismate synthase, partial [Mucinivorans sp.]
MNRFGKTFGVSIFGESHGLEIGVVLDGVPAGMDLAVEDFEGDLARRRSGARGTTPRKESDTPRIVSGLFQGHTTGAPLTILFDNENTRSSDYDALRTHPRPSHADLVAMQKWHGANDPRGGGHFSGRLTAPLVAAGVVAKRMLGEVHLQATLIQVGGQDASLSAQVVEQAMRDGDSVGGLIECRVQGLPVGLGEPFFDSAESTIAHALFAVPAVRGVEFGSGFAAAAMRGSEHNDPIVNSSGATLTNHAGGVVGGITNGNELIVRVAIKPTASISRAQ